MGQMAGEEVKHPKLTNTEPLVSMVSSVSFFFLSFFLFFFFFCILMQDILMWEVERKVLEFCCDSVFKAVFLDPFLPNNAIDLRN